jgi:hypothetical protein
MFILNPDVIVHKKCFNKSVSSYLESHGVPLLSIKEGKYYYAETDLLNKAIRDAPMWVKLGILLTT